MRKAIGLLWVGLGLAGLAGCGGGGAAIGDKSFAIGFAVDGLSGIGLQIQNNGNDVLTVSSNGRYTFTVRLKDAASFSVSIVNQPKGQSCSITGATGTVASRDVLDVVISCSDAPAVPLALTAVSPPSQARGVVRAALISATFDRSLAPSTVTSRSATVTGPQGNVIPGSVTVDGATLRIDPLAHALPGGTTYALALERSITDGAGNALATRFASQFSTAPQIWGDRAQRLASMQSGTGGLRPIAVLASPKGELTALWFHERGATAVIDVARGSASTGQWTAPKTLYAVAGEGASLRGVQVAANDRGDITLLWCESSYVQPTVAVRMAQLSAAGGDLSAPVTVSTVPVGAAVADAVMAMNNTGDLGVLTVAYKPDGTVGLYAVRRPATALTWSAPVEIPTASGAGDVGLSFDQNGGAVAAWLERPATTAPTIQVAAYNIGSGLWSAPVQVASSVSIGLFRPFAMVTDAAGATLIAWTRSNGVGGSNEVAAVRRDAVTGHWSAPWRLDEKTVGAGANLSGIAVDASGVVTAVWSEFSGVMAARLSPTAAVWSSPTKIAPGMVGRDAAVVADVAGNVSVLFSDGQQVSDARYSASDQTWQPPVLIGTPVAGSALFADVPIATIDGSGTVVAAWFAEVIDGSRQPVVLANVFR